MTVASVKPIPKDKVNFVPGDIVIYPGHGLGKVTCIERQVVGTLEVQVLVITFENDRMTLRVPLQKVPTSGLRGLSTQVVMDKALMALKGRVTSRRGMWSRRAIEYAAKIKSGDPETIAGVVRELYRNEGQPERSYSERLIYEQALDRLTREVAAIEKIEVEAATAKLESLLRAA